MQLKKDDLIFAHHMIDLLVMGCIGTTLVSSCLLLIGKITLKDHLPWVGIAVGSVCLASTCNVYKDGKVNHD